MVLYFLPREVLFCGESHLCPLVFCLACHIQCKGSNCENVNEYSHVSGANMIASRTSEWLRKLMGAILNCGNMSHCEKVGIQIYCFFLLIFNA